LSKEKGDFLIVWYFFPLFLAG